MMAKDYLASLPSRMKWIGRQYRWFRECGDDDETAFAKTMAIAARENWDIKSLLGHARHGRCGGNADEAMAAFVEFLADMRDGHSTPKGDDHGKA